MQQNAPTLSPAYKRKYYALLLYHASVATLTGGLFACNTYVGTTLCIAKRISFTNTLLPTNTPIDAGSTNGMSVGPFLNASPNHRTTKAFPEFCQPVYVRQHPDVYTKFTWKEKTL